MHPEHHRIPFGTDPAITAAQSELIARLRRELAEARNERDEALKALGTLYVNRLKKERQ